VVAEKPSDALFTLDTSGSQAIKKEVSKLYKPLKADEILAKRSAVPAVDNRKRRNVTDGIIEPVVKKRKSNGLKPEDFQKLKLRAYGGEAVAKDLIETGDVPSHDPWAVQEEAHDPRFSYLEKKKPVTAPKSLREKPISLLEGGKHIPAVTKPKPGTSYNPDFADWEKLLTEEGQKEVEAEKKRMQEAKEEEERQARIEAAQYDRDDLLTEDESVWEGIESEFEGRELSKKRPERKTPSERNKVKRRKEAERQAKHNAEMKRREEQAKKIREIAKEVNAQGTKGDILVASDGDDSDEEIDDRNLRRRKLGKVM
jgi:nucleolar protein 53